ncbi:MAG: hypothetical protein ACTTKW_08560 [Schwartzia sp. (in: firmicutes)]
MNRFLSVYGRGGQWMLKLLAGCTLIGFFGLLSMGRGWLIGALFVGYFAASVCCWSLTNRMSRGSFDFAKAKKQIRRGPLVRFGSLILILSAMAQISTDAFFVAAIGYFVFLALAFGCLLASRLHKADKGQTFYE